MEQPTAIPIRVLNPGFDRFGLEAYKLEEMSYNDAWTKLQWWESEWQARKGIQELCRNPFLRLYNQNLPDVAIVPTRVLYPDALHSSQEARIEESARYVVATVRQAREYYAAATAIGVTDLSRPVLYFYGALSLARAAVVALRGIGAVENMHGLEIKDGPSIRDQQEHSWPTLIKWQNRGEFAAFYRVARWDTMYAASSRPVLPSFHILECLRMLECNWGSLPPAINKPSYYMYDAQRLRGLLLPYEEGKSIYLTQHSELLERQFCQVPNIIVQYMVLRYFADLARYHPLSWQTLLEGAKYPEGYVFRVALESTARAYIIEGASLLPSSGQYVTVAPREWYDRKPSIDEWYQTPRVLTGHPTMTTSRYVLEEWEGN